MEKSNFNVILIILLLAIGFVIFYSYVNRVSDEIIAAPKEKVYPDSQVIPKEFDNKKGAKMWKIMLIENFFGRWGGKENQKIGKNY